MNNFNNTGTSYSKYPIINVEMFILEKWEIIDNKFLTLYLYNDRNAGSLNQDMIYAFSTASFFKNRYWPNFEDKMVKGARLYVELQWVSFYSSKLGWITKPQITNIKMYEQGQRNSFIERDKIQYESNEPNETFEPEPSPVRVKAKDSDIYGIEEENELDWDINL